VRHVEITLAARRAHLYLPICSICTLKAASSAGSKNSLSLIFTRQTLDRVRPGLWFTHLRSSIGQCCCFYSIEFDPYSSGSMNVSHILSLIHRTMPATFLDTFHALVQLYSLNFVWLFWWFVLLEFIRMNNSFVQSIHIINVFLFPSMSDLVLR
jgi:hypothetical protein